MCDRVGKPTFLEKLVAPIFFPFSFSKIKSIRSLQLNDTPIKLEVGEGKIKTVCSQLTVQHSSLAESTSIKVEKKNAM